MQTDKQQLTKLATCIRSIEQQMSRRGIALNPRVLSDSSDDEEPIA